MIRIVNRNQTVTIQGKKQVRAVLQELNLLPETVLVIRGNKLLMANDVIDEKEEVEIRPVISGGVFVANRSRRFGDALSAMQQEGSGGDPPP